MTCGELARRTGVSTGYVSQAERGLNDARPSAAWIRRVALAIGISADDLLELDDPELSAEGMHGSFADFVRTDGIPLPDVRMLAAIRFRGRQPTTVAGWRFLYEAVRRSVLAEPPGG